ncbi:protein kinase domain-containing protein [Endozoicomonadaceae bacterium StTr2]
MGKPVTSHKPVASHQPAGSADPLKQSQPEGQAFGHRKARLQSPKQYLSELLTKLKSSRLVQRFILLITPKHKLKPQQEARGVVPEYMGKVSPAPELKQVQLGEMLANGSFGTVHLAKTDDPVAKAGPLPGALKRQYVVKDQKLPRHNPAPKAYAIREEVRMQKKNPEAVRIPAHGEIDNEQYRIIMEHGGNDLFTLLHGRNGKDEQLFTDAPLPLPLASSITRQTLEQLKTLHDKGIAHRDVKIENILIDHTGSVRLADYGYTREGEGETHRFHDFAGTHEYMAPEILAAEEGDPEGYTAKADVWSTGIVMFEIMTGELFDIIAPKHNIMGDREGYEFHQSAYDHCIQSIKNNRRLTSDAKDLLLKMLDLDPNNRPSVEDALQHPFFTRKPLTRQSFAMLQTQHTTAFKKLARLEHEQAQLIRQPSRKRSSETKSRLEQLNTEISQLRDEVKTLQQHMQVKQAEASSRIEPAAMTTQLAMDKRAELDAARAELEQVTTAVDTLQQSEQQQPGDTRQITQLSQRQEQLQQQIRTLESALQTIEAGRR